MARPNRRRAFLFPGGCLDLIELSHSQSVRIYERFGCCTICAVPGRGKRGNVSLGRQKWSMLHFSGSAQRR
ncbi:protein of unknown function (plasmid) [Rhodovastum atsumiense]|nr:protein of unknown function [Rhodovastum atsumiense]